jgi:N-acetylglutamate synthase-like GNAT family acetyltransferase
MEDASLQDPATQLVAFPLAEWERGGLVATLHRAGLSTKDIGAVHAHYWRFIRQDDMPVGFGGLENHGGDALMRSVVTLPPVRGKGYARTIVAALESEAALFKCDTIWLLTENASGLFAKLGYKVVPREEMPESIRDSLQYSLSPASATAMTKRIG